MLNKINFVIQKILTDNDASIINLTVYKTYTNIMVTIINKKMLIIHSEHITTLTQHELFIDNLLIKMITLHVCTILFRLSAKITFILWFWSDRVSWWTSRHWFVSLDLPTCMTCFGSLKYLHILIICKKITCVTW